MISINNLSYRYPRSEGKVLNAIDLTIERGSLFGLLGPNGAGKTTLISLLNGLYKVPVDTVSIDGQCLSSNPRAIKKLSGYVPQEYAFYPNLSAQENLDFFSGVQGMSGEYQRQRIKYCLEFCQLEAFAQQQAASFSGGLKRRLNLAIGILTDPAIIYLDEPTVGIDPQSRAFILDKIKALQTQGKTIIYCSHYMEEVEKLCDHVAIIDRGEICMQGALADIQAASSSHLTVYIEQPLDSSKKQQLENQFTLVENNNELLFEGIDSLHEANVVLGVLDSIKVPVIRITYGHNNLENLFMAITKRALRD